MSFDEFMALRLPALLRYATLLTGDRDRASDLVQDVLVRALVRWERIREADDPYAYVRTMVTNGYLSQLRRRSLKTTPLTYDALDGPRAPADVDAQTRFVERADLWQRILRLSRRHRAVIVLRFYEGLSDGEIADTLGCRPSTVRAYMSRALGALRLELSEPAMVDGRNTT